VGEVWFGEFDLVSDLQLQDLTGKSTQQQQQIPFGNDKQNGKTE
jgi:hypothetical protein